MAAPEYKTTGTAKSAHKVRLTADLPYAEVDALKVLAEKQGVTMTEALRRAIATEKLLAERRAKGSRVLLDDNGRVTELVFSR